jgi:hypothetical protein
MSPKSGSKPYRKRHLFARSVDDVVRSATKPLMDKQGKIYAALLRDWERIVGRERFAQCRPERLQFPSHEQMQGATLHLLVRPAYAPSLTYECEQMLEQCARYFGYRAITRIILHASHRFAWTQEEVPVHAVSKSSTPPSSPETLALPASMPDAMRDVLARIAHHVSASDKKNSLR